MGLVSSDGLCYFPQPELENDEKQPSLESIASNNSNIILVPRCKRLFDDSLYKKEMDTLKEKLMKVLIQID